MAGEADSSGLPMQGGSQRRMRLTLILDGLSLTQIPRFEIDSAATVNFQNLLCAGGMATRGEGEGGWRRKGVVAQLTTDSRRNGD